jgi:hypothetical protein
MTRRRRLTIEDLPELPGYITAGALADRYGVTKETIYYLLYEKKVLTRSCKISKGVEGGRPLILVEERQGDEVMIARKKEKEERGRSTGTPDQLREWNRRVKEWGRQTNWLLTQIRDSGQPGIALQHAYLEAHPEDPRPA